MIGYIIAFLAGGYIIPALLSVPEVWNATRYDRRMTTADRVLTTICAAITWPMLVRGYVNCDQLDELRRRDARN